MAGGGSYGIMLWSVGVRFVIPCECSGFKRISMGGAWGDKAAVRSVGEGSAGSRGSRESFAWLGQGIEIGGRAWRHLNGVLAGVVDVGVVR